MLDLKKMTYINEDGLRVTDSRIIQKEFGIREHNKVMRTIRAVIKLEDFRRQNNTLNGSPTLANRSDDAIHGLFINSTFNTKTAKGNIKTYNKYEITEKGFYALLSYINGGSKEGKNKVHNIRMRFIDAFFTLREELNKMLKAYKILAEQFLPIDERGHISVFNDKERLFSVHGYFTSRRTRNEVTEETQQAFDTIFKSEHKIMVVEEVKAHEKNKTPKATPSKAFLDYLREGDINESFINEVAYKEAYKEWEL